MRSLVYAPFIAFALSMSACASSGASDSVCDNLPAGDVCAYDSARDADTDVSETLALAAATDRMSLIVFGANWCHDSRALAGHLGSERFSPLLRDDYQLTYVDVGLKNRNIDVVQRFGIDSIVGTPTVVIVDPDGTVRNAETAVTWRNSASRTADEIYALLEAYTPED